MLVVDPQVVDYTKFKLRVGNRPIKEHRIRRVMRSLQKYGYWPYAPIIVNAAYEIIEGQHRWMACIRLGITPTVVMVTDGVEVTADQIADMGDATGKWDREDRLMSLVSRGSESAIIFHQLCEEFGAKISVVARALGRTSRVDGITDMQLTSDEVKAARKILSELSIFQCVANHGAIYSNSHLVGSYMRVREMPNYDKARMRDRLENYGRQMFVLCTSIPTQVRNLVDVYNYGTRQQYKLPYPSIPHR